MNNPQPSSSLMILLASLLMLSGAACFGHDAHEITFDLRQKRSGMTARMEMARSTAVAACEKEPSLGVAFEPQAFPEWKAKIEAAGPVLLELSDADGLLVLISCNASLTSEHDVALAYVFAAPDSRQVELRAPVLSRLPPEGFGVQIQFRDKAGKWAIPALLRQDSPSTVIECAP